MSLLPNLNKFFSKRLSIDKTFKVSNKEIGIICQTQFTLILQTPGRC